MTFNRTDNSHTNAPKYTEIHLFIHITCNVHVLAEVNIIRSDAGMTLYKQHILFET